MKKPLDETRAYGAFGKGAPETEAAAAALEPPSKEEVERALARLVDAVLSDSRAGRRDTARRRALRGP